MAHKPSLIFTHLGETFELSPYRGLFRVRTKTLIISDVHLGKDSYFRKNGITIPDISSGDLNRMEFLLNQYQPETIIFLGDLFHSRKRENRDGLIELLKNYSDMRLVYISGNHDQLDPEMGELENLEFIDEFEQEGILFLHDDEGKERSLFVIQGHIHPMATVKIGPKQSRRYPSLIIQTRRMIMPAFGKFTGGYKMPAGSFDRLFILTPEASMEVPKGKFSKILC